MRLLRVWIFLLPAGVSHVPESQRFGCFDAAVNLPAKRVGGLLISGHVAFPFFSCQHPVTMPSCSKAYCAAFMLQCGVVGRKALDCMKMLQPKIDFRGMKEVSYFQNYALSNAILPIRSA
jgi:hypothetical protein